MHFASYFSNFQVNRINWLHCINSKQREPFAGKQKKKRNKNEKGMRYIEHKNYISVNGDCISMSISMKSMVVFVIVIVGVVVVVVSNRHLRSNRNGKTKLVSYHKMQLYPFPLCDIVRTIQFRTI